MLTNSEKVFAREAIKRFIRIYRDGYDKIVDENYEEYKKGLTPGQTLYDKSNIELSNESIDKLSAKADRCRFEIKEVLDPLLDKLEKEITTAPSTEAVNTIQLLTLRKNVSEEDIRMLMKRYGDNVQAYKAIRDIAANEDIHINDVYNSYGTHEVELEYNNINKLLSKFEKNPNGFEDRNGVGYISFMEASVESTFPVESDE